MVDVGAHIGSFSRMAYDLGASRILSFEADADNFNILKLNSEPFSGWDVENKAVWRSDHHPECCYTQKCAHPPNTGGGGVTEDFLDGTPVEPIGLDEIVERFGEIDILKIDAEGSEYQVLMTSSCLDAVSVIVGEYHQVRSHKTEANSVAPSHDVETLQAFLEDHDFTVNVSRADDNLGFFRAIRL